MIADSKQEVKVIGYMLLNTAFPGASVFPANELGYLQVAAEKWRQEGQKGMVVVELRRVE